jgi:cbb3-type cytochrome oxidase subunit 3
MSLSDVGDAIATLFFVGFFIAMIAKLISVFFGGE